MPPTKPTGYRPSEERIEVTVFAHRAMCPAASSPTDTQQTLVHMPHARSPPAFLLQPQAQGCGISPQRERPASACARLRLLEAPIPSPNSESPWHVG